MATITDVAKAAGVSTATISRVINNTGFVKDETRNRVLRVISELGYYPNAIGQNLRLNKTNVTMVIVPEITNPFIAEVVRSIESKARAHGYSVILHEYLHDGTSADDMERFISSRRIDGMIFLTAEAKLKEFERISERCPTVLACEYVDHLDIPSVSIDNIAAVIDAMRYLISLGHEKILFLNGEPDNISCRDRLRGYRISLEQAGIDFDQKLVVECACASTSAYEVMTRALEGAEDFSAVLCGSDVIAIGVMKAIHDRGLDIPGDISVIGFDDIEFSSFVQPALTTVYQPAAEIGQLAMQMMLDLYAGKSIEYPVKMRHELRIRESCGPRRQAR